MLGINDIGDVTALCGAVVALIAALRWVVFPLRRIVQLGEAQFKKNGGGSLVDKVEAQGNALTELGIVIAKISRTQDANLSVQDERHAQNSTRFDELGGEVVKLREDVNDLTIHNEYVMKLVSGIPTVLTPDGQAAWQRVLLEAEDIKPEEP